ncbi:hypothetical protein [Paenibacillus ihuae]|uniref:hypothetical protein n=1 Tax=Paenibacillus ihuae TaxID=1232431 RepID=UPI0006D58267|nr:hypothetical protein [Paenibacillus ihuae]
MELPTEREELIKEYFSAPVVAPPHLVSSTIRKINESKNMSALIGAATMNLILALLLTFFLLAGPLFLFWKIVILMVFCLFQVIAVALLVYKVFGGTLSHR